MLNDSIGNDLSLFKLQQYCTSKNFRQVKFGPPNSFYKFHCQLIFQTKKLVMRINIFYTFPSTSCSWILCEYLSLQSKQKEFQKFLTPNVLNHKRNIINSFNEVVHCFNQLSLIPNQSLLSIHVGYFLLTNFPNDGQILFLESLRYWKSQTKCKIIFEIRNIFEKNKHK